MAHRVQWAYGVTTVPARGATLLPRTLKSLAAAGFTEPRLFVDGCYTSGGQHPQELVNDLVTVRSPGVGAFGNWILGFAELYVREPAARFYAMFQDDLVCCKNLKGYLTRTATPDKGYWNLFTFVDNHLRITRTPDGREYTPATGWYASNQRGRGALALVFPHDALMELFKAQPILDRPGAARNRDRNIDGAVIHAMTNAGYTELVHYPSLVQHTGGGKGESTLGHQYRVPTSPCWKGEDWDPSTEVFGGGS